MGFIDSSPNPALPIFYNVALSVGQKCSNMRDDVKLVQYMLKKYYEAAPSNVVRPAGSKIEVTGEFDSPTDYAIVWYQNEIATIDPSAVTVDSRIDRILNKTTFKGSLSGKHYTLFWLNQNLKRLNPAAFVALPALVPLHNQNQMAWASNG
jgi:predicted transposase YdaD